MKRRIGLLAVFAVSWIGFAQEQDIFPLVQSGQVEKVREALRAEPALANAIGHAGLNPLFIAVSTGNLDMARLLIENGALVRVGDNNLRAPIHFANWAGNGEMVDLLLEKGALVDTRAIGGATPLIHSSLNNRFDMSRHLIERGADIHTQCNSLTTPLYFAVLNNNAEYLEYLLQAGAEVDVPDFLGRTPLAIAVRDGNAGMTKVLLNHGADPSRQDPGTGRSLLHLAASEGHVDVLEILLQAGLSVESRDRSGSTALDHALRYGHSSAARLLHERGAKSKRASHVAAARVTALPELKAGEAEIIKLQNRSWGVATSAAFLVFGYSETGTAPAEKSLANGHLTADALADFAARGRRVVYVDRDFHPAGRPFSLEGSNPVYSYQKDNARISFILNPAHDRHYSGLGLENAHFPRAHEPLCLDGLKVTVFPSYGAHSAMVLEVDGLTIVWLTGICDNYQTRLRDSAVIWELSQAGVRPDILLLGSPAGIGPEFVHGMREAFLEAATLRPGAVFAFGHGPLERKVRLQLERKKADLTALRTADNPGDRFFVRGEN